LIPSGNFLDRINKIYEVSSEEDWQSLATDDTDLINMADVDPKEKSD
jgi:hypothetical protein